MGNNFTDRLVTPVGTITGGLVGDNLFSQLKSDMILQTVFQTIFGSSGERIFTQGVPSYNETIFPLIEFWWGNEVYGNHDLILTGNIKGRIVLPTKMDSRADANVQRMLASAVQRFLGSGKHSLFQNVKGLTEFGVNSDWQYDRMFVFEALVCPAIEFTIPYKFDLHLLEQLRPDVNYSDDLTVALEKWVESYRITIKDDNTGELIIPEGQLYGTGQTNP